MRVELSKAIRYFVSTDGGRSIKRPSFVDAAIGAGIVVNLIGRRRVLFQERRCGTVVVNRVPLTGETLYFLDEEFFDPR